MDTKEIARFFALTSKVGPQPIIAKLRRFSACVHIRTGSARIDFSGSGVSRALKILSGEDESNEAMLAREEVITFMRAYKHVEA